MEKTQTSGDRGRDSLRRNHAQGVSHLHQPTDYMSVAEVVSDPRLTEAEKRALLAAWASDVHAVPDAPTGIDPHSWTP